MELDQVADLPEGSYVLIDTRDEISFEYGTLMDAENMPDVVKAAEEGRLPKDKRLILFCMHGFESLSQAAALRRMGYDAYSLKNGYGAWLREMSEKKEDRSREIEQSIIKKPAFRHRLFSRFAKAVKDYKLVEPGDRIAVCISGGKDSMLMAKLFQELKRQDKFPFELVYLVMDPGYNDLNRLVIENNAYTLGIPVTIFETSIFDAVYKIEKSPCYLCARMRRGHLYRKAKDLGCNKIALGHHYDDVIETNLMSMLWGGQIQTMMPKLKSQNFEGMELIRPMYLIREDDIKAWRDYNSLHFIQCACHFTDTCSSCRTDGVSVSKRMETKKLIQELKKTNPYVEKNIFNSMSNVNVDMLPSYKKDGVRHSFLDEY
ncbi:MAG: ATP-binding protein [Eubacterium sp.]|nr:ATP-binding protein [Eubacterium sp.]